jgi:hypothetical protein
MSAIMPGQQEVVLIMPSLQKRKQKPRGVRETAQDTDDSDGGRCVLSVACTRGRALPAVPHGVS